MHQTAHALTKIVVTTSIKLLHVSAPGCHSQKSFFFLFKKKEILAQHANLDTLHRPTWYTSHAPSGRDLFGLHKIETAVCKHTAYSYKFNITVL